ncbi:MAG: hypothetical protein K0S63_11 [Gammaproteobacteria bacterium]|jgi:hypothetical protein|nr:hypothetical protein [Gammaproteobacteria bacterium]
MLLTNNPLLLDLIAEQIVKRTGAETHQFSPETAKHANRHDWQRKHALVTCALPSFPFPSPSLQASHWKSSLSLSLQQFFENGELRLSDIEKGPIFWEAMKNLPHGNNHFSFSYFRKADYCALCHLII